ncbi:ATPase MORC2-like isoform X2 [Salvia splendens]|uniref:ATPase MORC2-like isoform X2 n=1 Tax=Salvia splendens TaxID=180675 RepID=UPI001C279828|nr:ATPase MORC2-like isoform X2 [Salvia splendens]
MTGFVMGDHFMEDTPIGEGCSQTLFKLTKDKRIISCAACVNPPSQMPAVWDITSIVRKDKVRFLSSLPGFSIIPACEDSHQEKEWGQFLDFLQKHNRVAISNFGLFEFYILPPLERSRSDLATVRYKGKTSKTSPGVADSDQISPPTSQSQAGEVAMSISNLSQDKYSPKIHCAEVNGDSSSDLSAKASSQLGNSVETVKSFQRNYVTAHPSYLKTLGQAHSSWIFGAVAELVDNARDAKATKLEIAINKFYSKIACKEIPMLSLIDDGHGMSHADIQRMVSFGHGKTEVDDPNHIGMYGIGFKTGTMRLGKDALVLTQTTNSRSIAFLSQSLNEGKDNLEIPIVSYRRVGQSMEVDTDVQNKDAAKLYLKIIKRYSPFDKYLIGEKVGVFGADGTGTQIYIWNLDEWGSDYSLKWEAGFTGGSSFHQGGIFIRSRRTRCRPGQMSLSVPLDYCLKSYLEVIFLDPRMKIYVQGALVRSRPLAKSLSKTTVENGTILGKPVQLTLGCSQLEWEQANSGIFLYWHGRLIEAYKRVGSMIHNGDCGRGIIGVADVTKIMDDENGCVWVHSNKQGFQDCEAYVELEQWLGEKANEYIDKYVDKIQLRKGNASVKPDHEWVQCDKCRKWRMLSTDFESKTLPSQWFCYMMPFNGLCDTPEESITGGTITISTKRHGYNTKDPRNGFREREAIKSEGISNYASDSEEDDLKVSVKRQMRSSLPRFCKKNG